MRQTGAAFGRGRHGMAEASGQIVHQCRVQLGRLLDIPSAAHIAFTLNCTDSLNLILRGVLQTGDRVVTSRLEHNSVLRPLTQLQKELDIDLNFVHFDPRTGVIDVEQFEHSVQTGTRLVVISHASNVTGVIQPIEQLSRIARDNGAMVLLDAAQTAGHVPLSMQTLGVDFLAAAGHKGLLGPLGTGLLAIRPGCEQFVRPVRCGGTGSDSESLQQPSQMPQLLESGNLNLPGIAGLLAGARWLSETTVEYVHSKTSAQGQRLRRGLQEIDGVRLYPSSNVVEAGRSAIVTFNIGELDCHEVALILDQSFSIQCRAGLHCAPLTHQTLGTAARGGAVRLSPGVFTTDQEITDALEAIAAIANA